MLYRVEKLNGMESILTGRLKSAGIYDDVAAFLDEWMGLPEYQIKNALLLYCTFNLTGDVLKTTVGQYISDVTNCLFYPSDELPGAFYEELKHSFNASFKDIINKIETQDDEIIIDCETINEEITHSVSQFSEWHTGPALINIHK